ncbi:copper resistance protein CopC [Novosphingobium sp.]|uniref:copper resistance protein CopC n=1 Tax=Novosphingobium sp. TaxID=1874826 RepID=UPI00261557A6|nr:copper resistance protein CopC [Novosphingobium sp.]
MRFLKLLSLAAAATCGSLLPAAALAHPRVVASTPAEGATIKPPRALSLTFSEPLSPATAAAGIVMTAMPGMTDHPPMTIRNFKSSWSSDKLVLTLNLREALPSGTYDVRWQAAGADGHRATGKVSFTVR